MNELYENQLKEYQKKENKIVNSFFYLFLRTFLRLQTKIRQLSWKNYADPQTGNGYGEKREIDSEFSQMGRCSTETIIYPIKQKEANISLNRLYLLNKFGQEKYFTSKSPIWRLYLYQYWF